MAEEVTRGWFGEWALLTKEWVIGAFCAATLDWITSKIPVRNGVFATLLSTAQLTTTYFLVNGLRGFFGTRRDVIYLADNWLLFNTIWTMSPTAVHRLTSSYRKIHVILYGSATIPQTAVVGSGCATGNCEEKK